MLTRENFFRFEVQYLGLGHTRRRLVTYFLARRYNLCFEPYDAILTIFHHGSNYLLNAYSRDNKRQLYEPRYIYFTTLLVISLR